MARVGAFFRGGLFGAFLVWLLHWPWVAATLLWSYLAVCAFGWLASVLRRAGIVPTPVATLVDEQYQGLNQRPNRVERVGRWLRAPSYALRTPRNFFHPILRWRLFSRVPVPVSERLRAMSGNDELTYATTGMWLVMLLAGYDVGGHEGHGGILGVGAWTVMAVTATRHAGYLLHQPDIAERVRQSFGRPWVEFCKIVLADLYVLVFCTWWVTGHRLADSADAKAFAEQIGSFVFFLDGLTLWRSRDGIQVTFAEITSLVVRVLFSATLFSGLVRFRSFLRTDADRIALARLALAHGATTTAEELLGSVREATTGCLLGRAQLALATCDPDDAWRLVGVAARAQGRTPVAIETVMVLGHLHRELPFSFAVVEAFAGSLKRRHLPEAALVCGLDPATAADVVVEEAAADQWTQSSLARTHPILVTQVALPRLGPEQALQSLPNPSRLAAPDRAFRELVRVKCVLWMAARDGKIGLLAEWRRHERPALLATIDQLDALAWAAHVYSLTSAIAGQFPDGSQHLGLSVVLSRAQQRFETLGHEVDDDEAVADAVTAMRAQAEAFEQADLEAAIRRAAARERASTEAGPQLA